MHPGGWAGLSVVGLQKHRDGLSFNSCEGARGLPVGCSGGAELTSLRQTVPSSPAGRGAPPGCLGAPTGGLPLTLSPGPAPSPARRSKPCTSPTRHGGLHACRSLDVRFSFHCFFTCDETDTVTLSHASRRGFLLLGSSALQSERGVRAGSRVSLTACGPVAFSSRGAWACGGILRVEVPPVTALHTATRNYKAVACRGKTGPRTPFYPGVKCTQSSEI